MSWRSAHRRRLRGGRQAPPRVSGCWGADDAWRDHSCRPALARPVGSTTGSGCEPGLSRLGPAMILERAFPVSSILLAAIGFLGLVLTGEIPGGLILLGLASLVVSSAQAMEFAGERLARQIANLSSVTWNVFLIAVFVFFGADLLLISRDILPAAVHLLILLMSIRLFHLRQRND